MAFYLTSLVPSGDKGKKSWIYLLLFFTIIVLPDWVEIFMVNIPIKIAFGELLRAYLVLFIPLVLFGKWYKIYLLLLLYPSNRV